MSAGISYQNSNSRSDQRAEWLMYTSHTLEQGVLLAGLTPDQLDYVPHFSLLISPCFLSLLTIYPFPPVQKNPLTSGFCLQWEWIQSVFTPGSNDSAVDTGFLSAPIDSDGKVTPGRTRWFGKRESASAVWCVGDVQHDAPGKGIREDNFCRANGKGVNRLILAGLPGLIKLILVEKMYFTVWRKINFLKFFKKQQLLSAVSFMLIFLMF